MKDIYTLPYPAVISAAASVAGKTEHEGPLSGLFDYVDISDTFGAPTWEQSESESGRLALGFALNKRGIVPDNIDLLLAGDLMNQCTGSSYGLLNYKIPFLGLYGACSTCAEGLLLAALSVGNRLCGRAAVVTSSHFCSAERQFRLPLEYGGQRAPVAGWTVTGAGAFIVEGGGRAASHNPPSDDISDPSSKPRIVDVMPGRVIDAGFKDIANMGAAMAPAAIDTLERYFKASGTVPSDYDAVYTGDLGFEGSGILVELMGKNGYMLGGIHRDCGLMIYDRLRQDVHAGGSGCGCSAVTLAAKILPSIERGEQKNVLFLATGALMSPSTVAQKLSIPAIAHVIHITL